MNKNKQTKKQKQHLFNSIRCSNNEYIFEIKMNIRND
jgi:hypothetical protein